MTRALRSCPICPRCGCKKFRKLNQLQEFVLICCVRCGCNIKI